MGWRSRGRGWGGYRRWDPYVPVWKRRADAERKLAKLRKKGRAFSPVKIEGREIARTFWGKAWCDNLEAYSDFENRLPRGRTYVRNGSVMDLQVAPGKVTALVSGSDLYTVEIGIRPVARPRWRSLCRECAGGIGSLVELLRGKLSREVMGVITRKETGLFPSPGEIEMKCSCPDWATMCKHVAASLYGVGARLDAQPDLLFLLRGVDHMELVGAAVDATPLAAGPAPSERVLVGADLPDLFGIDLDERAPSRPAATPPVKPTRTPARGVPRRRAPVAAGKKTPSKRSPQRTQRGAEG